LLTARDGPSVVAHYGRPERTYRAVRNVAGVIEHGFGVLVVQGPRRREAVDKQFSNELPEEDAGTYGFVRQDDGIAADAYVFDAGDRFLAFVPPDRTGAVVEAWRGTACTVSNATTDFAVFGVYGPKATEKIGSVASATAPDTPLSIARGTIREAGVTIIRDDGLTGEEGYLVVAASDDAEPVFDALINRGLSGAPFGYETWATLTLAAGTPLFETELRDATPATVGVANAFPDGAVPTGSTRRLRGFTAKSIPESGASASVNGEAIGRVTRARERQDEGEPIGFAILNADVDDDFTIGDDRISATVTALPFVDGSGRSKRIPHWE
jgi:aminomethyltransferase